MTWMSRCLSLLARMAEVNIVFDKSIDAGEPVVSSDQFDGSGNAKVSEKWRVMVFSQDVHTQ